MVDFSHNFLRKTVRPFMLCEPFRKGTCDRLNSRGRFFYIFSLFFFMFFLYGLPSPRHPVRAGQLNLRIAGAPRVSFYAVAVGYSLYEMKI